MKNEIILLKEALYAVWI